MTQFNPFVGSILQSSQVARQQAAAKSAQIRRTQQLQRNVALAEDQLEHQVESSEALTPTHDRDAEPRDEHPKQQKSGGDDADDPPHVDLTA